MALIFGIKSPGAKEILCISSCFGIVVTMATETGLCNFANGISMELRFKIKFLAKGSLGTIAILGKSCCYGILVTMVTRKVFIILLTEALWS